MLGHALSAVVASVLFAPFAFADDIRSEVAEPSGCGTFVENLGQFDARAAFVSSSGATTIFATDGGFRVATLDADGHGVGVCFSFGGDAVSPVALAEVPGRFHYLRGTDPSRWVSDARAFDGVAYRNVRPGVDVILRSRNGGPSFDFVLAAGADVATLPVIEVTGVDALRIDAGGGVEADTAIGSMTLTRPLSAAIGVDGSSRALPSRFELAGPRSLRVVVEGSRNGERVLVDPNLEFSTFLGGTATFTTEYAEDVTFDQGGAPIVIGWVQAADFPVTPGAFDVTLNGLNDVSVTKFTADGSALVFSTLIGGIDYDEGRAIAVGTDGTLFVTGETRSTNFPVTAGAFDTTLASSNPDGFLVRLTANGSALVWSTLFGGTSNENPLDIVVDAAGSAYVVGTTNSTPFPTTPGAFDTQNNGFNDGFVTKFAPGGNALTYSTLLGAPGVLDSATGVALAANGEVYVTGFGSAGFPFTHESFDPTHNGSLDAFVVHLNDAGSGLVAGTFLGGQSDDQSFSIALGPDGSATICGDPAFVFPTTPGAYDPTPPGAFGDAFVARFDASLETLVYSTYIGGNQEDEASDVVVDASGAAIVIGTFLNGTVTFPTTPDAIASTIGYSFLTRFDPTGSSLTYSTFLSSVAARPEGLAVQSDGSVFVTGLTPTGFPVTPGAYDTTIGGGGDVFLAKFDLCPGEVESHGTGCVGAGGFTPLLDVTGCASPGFELKVDVSNTLGHTSGLLLFGLGTASLPLNGSCALVIGPLAPALVIPITLFGHGPGAGFTSFGAEVPAVATPVEFHLQAVVGDPNVPGGVSASNAVRVRIDS